MKGVKVMNDLTLIITENRITSISMSELYDKFVIYLEVSEASVRTYTFGVRKFLQYLNQNSILMPTRETVITYRKELEKNCKPATVSLYLSSIRKFFSWCELSGLYPNITNNVKSPKQDTGHKRDALSGEQIKKVLNSFIRDSIESKRNYAIFLLMACCGLRTIEVSRANIEDIRVIYGETVLFIQGKGKTSKADFVKLPEIVHNAINNYLSVRGEYENNEPLFSSLSNRNMGGRLSTRSISGICKNSMINAGYNSIRLTAHSLRHSAITIALLNGAGLQEVQTFARHSSLNTTMIYSHAVDKLKSHCENTIAGAIFAA